MRFEKSSEHNEQPQELLRLRDAVVAEFADKYTMPIRPDENVPDVKKGGPSLDVASRAALIVARAAHALQSEVRTTRFSTNDSHVEIVPREEMGHTHSRSAINPWSEDATLEIHNLVKIRIARRTIERPFANLPVVANLVYDVELLPRDTGRVVVSNLTTKGGTRIIELEEANDLAEFLYSIFETDEE